MAKEMLFSVVCPTCEAKIGVHDQRLINQLVQCPKCGSIVQLTPPEGRSKNEKTAQNIEDKPEKIVSPPKSPVSLPRSEKKVEDEKKQSEISALSVPKASIPVPPPVSIPVPPPVSIPEPLATNTLMPEPMSPGGLNSNSSSDGKGVSQRVRSLTEKMPYWTPYLVIGIGVMALIAMIVFFFFSPSKKEGNNNSQPTVENSKNAQDGRSKETVVVETIKNKGNEENNVEELNGNNTTDDKNEGKGENETILSIEENDKNGEDLTLKNEENKDSVILEDKTDKNAEVDTNNKSVENVENIDPETETAQPKDDSEVDNPFQEVEQKPTVQKPEQNISSVDNPIENEDGIQTKDNDVTPENISNYDSSPEEAPSEQIKSNSELSSIPGLNIKLKSISIREQKLSQCLQTIREIGALPVEVKWDSLRRNGVNADDKITWSGTDVTVQTALTEVLGQRGLMFKINEEGKLIFVPRVSVNARSGSDVNLGQRGSSSMVKAQYSVSDLVGHSPEQTALLIKSIQEFLCPGDWKEVGGTGSISASGVGSVTVIQSQQNQWIIADFLDRLRLARHLAPLYNRDASLEPMSVRAQSALKRNVGINFQPSADLKTALSEIGQRISANILLDEPSLKIAGISAQFPISFDARELSLEETFNRINEETGLTYLAQTPNSFIVTTPDGMKSMMSVEFYPISDLVNIGLTPTVLMEQIVKFEPKSWKSQDAASFGLIDFDANSDCLIVRQSPAVLSQISALLTQLRARLKQKE